jgi:flagellar basal-body rod modification protein FlgD
MTNVANTASTASTAAVVPTTDVTNDKAVLDKDGFLKMLVAQMQNQDPSSPMSTSEQTQQMAAFTQVEQITNMAAQNAKMLSTMTAANSVGLIGRTVDYTDINGDTQTGKVERVSTSSGGATTLTVAGQTGIDPTAISSVS